MGKVVFLLTKSHLILFTPPKKPAGFFNGLKRLVFIKNLNLKNMTENKPITGEQIALSPLWEIIEQSLPNTHVIHKKTAMGRVLHPLLIFCPLYYQGHVRTESRLINAPLGISEAGVVHDKWLAMKEALKIMQQYLASQGGRIEVHAVLANKGVLLHQPSTTEDEYALTYHKSLYEIELKKLEEETGVLSTFEDYDSLGVRFPRFVNPEEMKGSSDPSTMILTINQFLSQQGGS